MFDNFAQIIRNNKLLLLVISTLGMLLFQASFITLLFDDFGSASLSYGFHWDTFPDAITIGRHPSFVDNIVFMKWWYLNWSGRILPQALVLFFTQTPLIIFKIVQTLLVAVFVIAVSFFQGQKDEKAINIPSLMFASGVLFSIPIFIYRETFMFINGSVFYVFTAIFTFLLILFTNNLFLKQNLPNNLVIHSVISLSFFFTSGSHEFNGLFLWSYLIVTFLYKKLSKSYVPRIYGWYLFVSSLGFFSLILAPGQQHRINDWSVQPFYNLPLFERTFLRIQEQISLFYSPVLLIPVILLIICAFILIHDLIQKNVLSPYLSRLLFGITVLFTTGYMGSHLMTGLSFTTASIFHYPLLISFTILLFFLLLKWTQTTNHFYPFSILSSLFVIYSAMVLSPYSGPRTLFIIYLMTICLVISVMQHSILYKNIKILALIFMLIGFMNYTYVTMGYIHNYSVHDKSNDKVLKNTALLIHQGISEIQTIQLKKYNAEFDIANPWDAAPYQQYWIKYYYDIPQKIIIEYVD